jgi:glycine oxidase
MFAVRPEAETCRHVLQHGDACLVPSWSGELLVGSLVEDAGFTKAVTAAGVATLLGHLGDIAPAARRLPITRMWSGLRPFREGGPLIDRHPGLSNVVVATGHHRNGILLAPITAIRVKAILDGVPPVLPVPSVQLNG